ncbi:MAG: DUF1648 domain-containing protein [Bacillota bacterium]|nr:DUF1648 domain-containing protein [Bacillota bacterium]
MTTVEKVIKVLSGLLIAILFLYIYLMWSKLPEKVPTHFNAAGQVDGWDGKSSIWMVPIIGLVLFVMLSILERFPHIFNYPFMVTKENAPKLYLEARRLLVILNLEIILFFALVSWGIVQAAFGHDSLSIWFIPVFLIVIFGTLGIVIYRLFRVR